MKKAVNRSTLELEQGDITTVSVDVIVNAANTKLAGGGGVDGAIHRAGGPAIMEECRRIGGCPTGQTVATNAGNLPAKRVYHTVGPVWNGGTKNEDALLASCYRTALELAASEGYRSLAFPSISTGVYRFPVDRAAAVAIRTIFDFLLGTDEEYLVKMVLFDDRTFLAYANVLRAVS